MMTIKTNHGEFTGKTLETILKREYGKNARISARNLIVKPAPTGNYQVLARLIWTETADGELRYY